MSKMSEYAIELANKRIDFEQNCGIISTMDQIDYDDLLGEGFTDTYHKNMKKLEPDSTQIRAAFNRTNKHNIRSANGRFIKTVQTWTKDMSDRFAASLSRIDKIDNAEYNEGYSLGYDDATIHGKNYMEYYMRRSNKFQNGYDDGMEEGAKAAKSKKNIPEKSSKNEYNEIAEFVYQKTGYVCGSSVKWRKIGCINRTHAILTGYDLDDGMKIKNFLISRIVGGIDKVTFTQLKEPGVIDKVTRKDHLYDLGFNRGANDFQAGNDAFISMFASKSFKDGYNAGYKKAS
jgi:hypothetical protein